MKFPEEKSPILLLAGKGEFLTPKNEPFVGLFSFLFLLFSGGLVKQPSFDYVIFI